MSARDPMPMGRITGELILSIDGYQVNIGTIKLPLQVTRECKTEDSQPTFTLGVDLEKVRRSIKEVFMDAEVEKDR